MKKKNSLTIYEISAKAGVSIATVSRALNPHTRSKVAVSTLKRIEELVSRTGYTPSLAAKQMAGAKTRVIGVIMAHFKGVFFSDYHSQILAGVADALMDTEYGFKLIMLKPDQETRWDHYDFKNGENVDGLIITHWGCFFASPECFKRMRTPCAVIGDPDATMRVHRVHEDSAQGGKLAAKYLYDCGHRNVLILAGSEYSTDSRDRVESFRSFFQQHAPEARLTVRLSTASRESLSPIVQRDIEGSPTTAVFACNDDTALQLLEIMRERGIRCPEDVSLMGYDDDKRTRWVSPSLSTVRVSTYNLAFQGVLRLVEYLKDGGDRRFFGLPTVLSVELVERESVRCVHMERRKALVGRIQA